MKTGPTAEKYTLLSPGAHPLKKGEWRLSDDGRSVILSCPLCGRENREMLGDVRPDGRVSRSFSCLSPHPLPPHLHHHRRIPRSFDFPPPDCGFHEFVRLIGWTHQKKKGAA